MAPTVVLTIYYDIPPQGTKPISYLRTKYTSLLLILYIHVIANAIKISYDITNSIVQYLIPIKRRRLALLSY